MNISRPIHAAAWAAALTIAVLGTAPAHSQVTAKASDPGVGAKYGSRDPATCASMNL